MLYFSKVFFRRPVSLPPSLPSFCVSLIPGLLLNTKTSRIKQKVKTMMKALSKYVSTEEEGNKKRKMNAFSKGHITPQDLKLGFTNGSITKLLQLSTHF